ncbi:MAG: group II truncated hemoglobin [Amylibacter sp.]
MKSVLDQIGGESILRDLVDTFYDLVEQDPRGESLRGLHFKGHGIAHARIEQFNFLSAFLGGRRYYAEKHGHMDVKLMHAHVPITNQDAEDWLFLMEKAIDEYYFSEPLKNRLMTSFKSVALILVNDGVVAGDASSI